MKKLKPSQEDRGQRKGRGRNQLAVNRRNRGAETQRIPIAFAASAQWEPSFRKGRPATTLANAAMRRHISLSSSQRTAVDSPLRTMARRIVEALCHV